LSDTKEIGRSAVFGLGAPRNTPAEIIGTLNKEINAALADPNTKARLADLGGTALAGLPADFGKLRPNSKQRRVRFRVNRTLSRHLRMTDSDHSRTRICSATGCSLLASVPRSSLNSILSCNRALVTGDRVQFDQLKRREFITLLGGTAAWPIAARAQERMRRLAALMQYTEDNPQGQRWLAALRDDLQKLGWIERRNLHIDYRWGGTDMNLLQRLAKEIVAAKPDVILSSSRRRRGY
jgi:hypothetical protein